MALLPGIYKARVVKHWWTTSNAGNAGLAVQVSIVDDFGGEETVTGTIWITDKAMGMARSQLKELGFDVDRQELLDIGASVFFDGREISVTLKEEDFRGRRSLKVDRFGGQSPPPTKEQLAMAQRGLRAAKKQEEYSAPVEPPAAPPAKKSPAAMTPEERADEAKGDSEIPF